MKSLPSFRVLSLASFLVLSLVPYGWNKFDNPTHAGLLYVLGGLLVFLLALSWKQLISTQSLDKPWLTTDNLLRIAAILLPVLSFIAFFLSPIQNLGWSEVMVMAVGIAVFVIVRTFSEKEKQDILRILAFIAVICALFGFSQYLLRDEGRIAGPFYQSSFKAHYWPNAFALFLLLMWPLAASIPGTGRAWVYTRIATTSLVLSALLLTFSRAAILAALIQVILLCWMGRKQLIAALRSQIQARNVFLPLLSVGLLTIVLVVGLHSVRSVLHPASTNSFATKASFAGTEKQTSFTERGQFMSGAARLALEKPWFGHGPFSFRFVYPRLQTDFLAVSDHPHNWILKLAMEQGIPVALMFILLVGMILYTQRQLVSSGPLTTSSFVFVAIIGVLSHNIADYNMNFLSNQLAFWSVLGLLAPTTLETAKESSRKWWGMVTVISILLVAGALLTEGYFSFTRQYDRMMFPRNLFLDRARGESAQGKMAQSVASTKRHLALNPYDAYAWDFLGRTLEPTDPKAALESYRKAVESDGANVFDFYLHYLRVGNALNLQNTDDFGAVTKRARMLLVSYPALAEANIHYTAQSGNVLSAVELARLLGEDGLATRIEAARKKWAK